MVGQAQLSIEDMLCRMSKHFIEQLLMMAAESVAGPYPRFTGNIAVHAGGPVAWRIVVGARPAGSAAIPRIWR